MEESDGFARSIRKFLQKQWRKITIAFLIVVLATFLAAYLRGRGRKRKESGVNSK